MKLKDFIKLIVDFNFCIVEDGDIIYYGSTCLIEDKISPVLMNREVKYVGSNYDKYVNTGSYIEIYI